MPRLMLSRLTSPAAIAALATLVLAALVAVATLTPLPRVVAVGGSDKLHHVLAFAVLALPVSVLRPRWLPSAALLLAGYGGAIELVQPFVGRSCELMDWIADLGGIALGSCAGLLLNRLAAVALRGRSRLREAG